VVFRCLLFTRREAIASPSTWRDFKAHFDGFHASGYNSAESEPIWVKFGILWAKCWGLATADFGRDPRGSDSLRGSRNFVVFLVTWITHDFTDFPSNNFHEFCTQQRRSVSRCKRTKQNFENFIIRGRFSKKRKNFSKMFQIWRLQAARTPQW